MKRFLLFLLMISLFACLLSCGEGTDTTLDTVDTAPDITAGDTTTEDTTTEAPVTTLPATETTLPTPGLSSPEAIKLLREEVWQEYVASLPASREKELVANKISYVTVKNIKMKVETKVVGDAPEGGYPLFIVLHGGGSDPTGEMNESQWQGMAGRYSNIASLSGIFVSCRAIEDTWNCHSVDNAYMFYDRIIEDAVIYLNANPNKAYIVGYSAGGDGVYQIAPRMPDRFAAANMTAGHPNSISMINTYNLPFFLQVGELDTAYNRFTETVKYGNLLTSLAEQYGGGYIHDVMVHAGKEHGVVGDNQVRKQKVVDDLDAWLAAGGTPGVGGTRNATTHAAHLMAQYERDPIPQRVIWDLSTRTSMARGVDSFYWISTKNTTRASRCVLDISYDKETNTVRLNSIKGSSASTTFTVYLNEDMLDLFSDVTFEFNGEKTVLSLALSEEMLRKTTEERGDPNFQFVTSFSFNGKGEIVD